MKIIELHAENVKRLKVVQIRPTGCVVEITGKNGQGKSSVLDSIWWALAGLGNVQSVPIRKGESKATIRLDLGEVVVTRTFRKVEGQPFTSTLIVENGEGMRPTSPQRMLDGLIGQLSFDPLAFSRMEPKAQLEAMRRFVPDVDFDAIDKANRDDFTKRTDVNRRAKEARARRDGILISADVPQVVDVAALSEALESAGRTNAEIATRTLRREQVATAISGWAWQINDHDERIGTLRAEIESLEEAKQGFATAINEAEARLKAAEPLPEPVDTSALSARITAATETNRKAAEVERAREDRARYATEAKALEDEGEALTAAMAARNAEKTKAIAAANLPVAGLEFGADEILLDGLPFDQASDAMKLRTSIAIAMASNPKLRVIRVRDGSLLDEEAMTLLGEMASAADYQVWIERVDGSGKVGIVLEDGNVREPAAEMGALL